MVDLIALNKNTITCWHCLMSFIIPLGGAGNIQLRTEGYIIIYGLYFMLTLTM